MYEERSYYIIPSTEVPNVDFNYVLETSAETLRFSVDGNKTFVKWEGNMPPEFVVNMTGERPLYLLRDFRYSLHTRMDSTYGGNLRWVRLLDQK